MTKPQDGFTALDAFHQKLLVQLAALEDLSAALARGDENIALRAQARAVAEFFSGSARQHHEDEERHVFPLLMDKPDLVQSLLRLQQDHGWIEEDWMALEPQLQSVANGHSGWDGQLIAEEVGIFAALLRDHLALEESLIYPEARSRTDLEGRQAMGREMAARRRAERAHR